MPRRQTGSRTLAPALEAARRLEFELRLLLGTAGDGSDAESVFETARAAYAQGRTADTRELIETALRMQPSRRVRAEIQHLRGRLEMLLDRPLVAYELLLTEAAAIEGEDDGLAAAMMAEASYAALVGNEPDLELAAVMRARQLAEGQGRIAEAAASRALGVALVLAGEPGRGAELVRASLDAVEVAEMPETFRHLTAILVWVEEYDVARTVLERVAALARHAGRHALPGALDTLAALDYRTGRWNSAEARSTEAARLAEELGLTGQKGSCLTTLARIDAARGREAESRSRIAAALDLASPGDLNFAYAVSASGLLELGLGRAEAAVDELEKLTHAQPPVTDPMVVSWVPELIEAYTRTGNRIDAERQLDVLDERAEKTQRRSTLAAAARCRGLLALPAEFESFFRQALDHHAEVPTPFERARTELCFGERLRRARRRADAGMFLQSALATFEQLGAQGWAAQARRELAAARGRRARRGDERPRLTPREAQVAALVQRGLTNKEVAAHLFVSPKAIDYHLGNIYRKLDLRSRTELARRELD